MEIDAGELERIVFSHARGLESELVSMAFDNGVFSHARGLENGQPLAHYGH